MICLLVRIGCPTTYYYEPPGLLNECHWSVIPQNKTNQITPEYTVELRGATVGWAPKDKSSKKNVLEVWALFKVYQG